MHVQLLRVDTTCVPDACTLHMLDGPDLWQALLFVTIRSILEHQDGGQHQPYATAAALGGPVRTVEEERRYYEGRVDSETRCREEKAFHEAESTADSQMRADGAAASYSIKDAMHITELQFSRQLGYRVGVSRQVPLCDPSMLSFTSTPRVEPCSGSAALVASLTQTRRCSFRGQSVAVKLVRTAADQAAAQREVAAHARMSSLQGVHVPRPKAHGFTLGSRGYRYFVANEFVEVSRLRCSTARHAVSGCGYVCAPT